MKFYFLFGLILCLIVPSDNVLGANTTVASLGIGKTLKDYMAELNTTHATNMHGEHPCHLNPNPFKNSDSLFWSVGDSKMIALLGVKNGKIVAQKEYDLEFDYWITHANEVKCDGDTFIIRMNSITSRFAWNGSEFKLIK